MNKKFLTVTAIVFSALLASGCGGSSTEGTIVTLANGEQAGVIMTIPQTDETSTYTSSDSSETTTVETENSAEDGLVVVQSKSAANDYSFTYLGTVITPGDPSDPVLEKLGTTYDYYENTADADNQTITAKIYAYSEFVLLVTPNASGDYISAIYLNSANCVTNEGIAFGAPSDSVIEAYGENYTAEGDAIVYNSGNIKLSFYFTNGTVTDIIYEYAPDL